VCKHFGEQPKWERCGTCDICAGTPDWLEVQEKRSGGRRALQSSLEMAAVGGGQATGAALSLPDTQLREYLREWRRDTARDLGVAAFVVLHDTALNALCAAKPSTLQALRAVNGFGDKKVERYGKEILEAFARFNKGERASNNAHSAGSHPREDTLRLLKDGRTFAEIAEIRSRKVSSVVDMVVKLMEDGDVKFDAKWLSAERYTQVAAAVQEFGKERLKPVKDALPEEITYEEIRLVATHLRQQRQEADKKGRGFAPRCSPS
jgi:ATP-dependent DNA helicase RecQ